MKMGALYSYPLFLILFIELFKRDIVIASPFDVEPSDTEVIEGGLAILRCTISDLDDGSIYWRYIDHYGSLVPLSKNRDIQKYAAIHGALSRRLKMGGDPNHGEYNLLISNITIQDQRQYVCTVITDGAATDSRRATIVVRPSHPLLPDEPDPLPVCSAKVINSPGVFRIGAMVRFICASPAGYPDHALRWTRIGDHRTTLVTCPGTPCVHNRVLSIDDVVAEFVCEMSEDSTAVNDFECSSTPLTVRTGVFIDPPVSDIPVGNREGFVCLPVNYDPNHLLFQWYIQSEIISNGTNMSTLNLRISRNHAGSQISCVVSDLDGTFRGIGHARIDPYDPLAEFPSSESSSIPLIVIDPPKPVTPKGSDNGFVQDLYNGTGGGELLPSTTMIPTSRPGLTIQPIAELNNDDENSQHLSVLVAVSAISGALITLLVCIIGLGALLFLRRRRRREISLQKNAYVYETDQKTCGGLEMSTVNPSGRKSDQDICGYSEIKEKRISLQQSFVSDLPDGSERFYATLESDGEPEYAEGVISQKVDGGERSDSAKRYGPPCTPSDYARPQARPVGQSDQLNNGMINGGFSRSHERNLSDCSASAYAVTDIVSEKARFVFKDVADRQQSGELPATMSRALVRNQSAPPLPARTLPRALSTYSEETKEDEPFGQRRQSDTDAMKDRAKSASKAGIGNRWPWNAKPRKGSSRTLTEESLNPEPLPIEESGRDQRSLSLGSGGSGEYAEIVSVDSVNDSRSSRVNDWNEFSPTKRHSMTGERLDSIPERAATTANSGHTDKDNTDPGYDRLARPKLVLSSPAKTSPSSPIYAKVNKSKSLDQETSQTRNEKLNNHPIPITGEDSSKASTSPMLHRTMSEGASPSVEGKTSRYGGYETVETSEKLNNILTQIRNGFAGKTVDIPEIEERDESQTKMNKGGHFAEIV